MNKTAPFKLSQSQLKNLENLGQPTEKPIATVFI